MAYENGNGGGMMTMPVAPLGYGGGYGGSGFGWGGDSGWFILLLILAMGNGMWGGWGGLGGMMGGFGDWGLYPWLNNSQNINGGFRDQMLNTQVSSIGDRVTSGFGDVQLGIAGLSRQVCESGNGVTAAVTGAQNALAQQLYQNEIASLNRSFDEQTANVAGFTGVQSKLADCCCENRLATQALQTAVVQDGAATRQAIAQGIQSIQDKLCQLELDGVKSDLAAAQRENAGLQNQLNMAAFRADNIAQTAAIERSQADQTQYIVNRVAPYPQPAIVVGYGCNGYGYNNGFGGGFGPSPFGNVGFGNGTF